MDREDFYRITHTKDKWFEEFYHVYNLSFPLHEQRTRLQQEQAFEHTNYHLDCLIDGNKFLGFIAWWDFGVYAYIEHLAIHPSERGNNLGSWFLETLSKKLNKTLLLEIDPLTDEISKRRLGFYERNGFHLNSFSHFHPPYREGYLPHELLVLTSPEPINAEIYEQFRHELSSVVMNFIPTDQS